MTGRIDPCAQFLAFAMTLVVASLRIFAAAAPLGLTSLL
jgi:hypothetical protein